ncbi:GSCOCG00007675001-RA-CDS [Cotesia congregata]|nr:GSCOCG00007675001-RA-CDS [Cotesia congregata]
MKWKRGSMDFFPEKTFLIIKDNVETFSVKKSYRRMKSKSAADTTGTWPPKVKKNSLFVAVERPKTANLERPAVLNPALVNKLDMSLLSKERLCDSMTRIQLDRRATTSITVSGGGYTLPANNNKQVHQQQATSIVQSSNNSIASLTEAKTFFIRSKRPTFQHLIINNYYLYDQPTTTTMPVNHKLDPVIVKKSPSPVLNNNRQTIKLTENKITGSSLSIVRTSKSSRLALPEELKVFTTSATVNKLKTPEPCKTCGRPDQPERFHSHPKGLPLKGITDKIIIPKIMLKNLFKSQLL